MKASVHNVGDDDASDTSESLLASQMLSDEPKYRKPLDDASVTDLGASAIGRIDVGVSQTSDQKNKPGRRGKHRRTVGNYNPFAILTVVEALPFIRAMARQYPELSVEIRSWLSLYIAPEMSLDYYYGSYVTAMKIVAMMHASKDSIRDGIVPLVQALAAKIVEMVDAAHATWK